jgi:hypothetical protein
MSALEKLLAGLFDYAGLYPPASLGMRSAANNYLEYRRSGNARALGRFIVNLDRLEEFRSVAGDSLEDFEVSIIANEDANWASLATQISGGLPIGAVEVKCSDPPVIGGIVNLLPHDLEIYFEVQVNASNHAMLKAIRDAGARAKIRMGGIVAEAIPPITDVAQTLRTLATFRLPFKATAGLHHPLRSTQPLTYTPECPRGVMHGFVNLSAAAAFLYFGGSVNEAECLLAEEDPAAFRVKTDSLHWRDHTWTTDQLATIRGQFFMSIGSCSFDEPIHDLQSLGWL